MSRIFADNAPQYYAHGLQVIPLFEREKKPIPSKWSTFSSVSVTPEQQEEWLRKHAHGNMGLVLGEKSGVMCIDIDTEDMGLFQAIVNVLPPSPWHRRGRKGLMLAYRYSPKIRTFRVKKISGEMIVENLGKGTQCVLPPSIHPETQQPYTSNTNLYDVLDQLNYLPDDIEETLRKVLTDHGVELSHSGWSRVTEFVSAGSRDTTLTELAGLFAYAVVRGERTLKEAVGMLMAYGESFIEKVAGDEVDINKHVSNLIKFLHRDIMEKKKVLPKGWDAGYTPEELENLGVTLDSEHTEWDFEEARDYLHTVFENSRPGSSERVEGIEIVLDKISKSISFSKIDEDRILGYIMDVSGVGVKLSTLRARLKELRTGPIEGKDHSEIARAMLADLNEYMTVRYHHEDFWKWAGSHWEKLDANFLRAKISGNYGSLPACRKSSDIRGILEVMSYLCEQGIQKKSTPGVNFANGFLTEDLVLMPHDKDYGMIYTLPFRYLPEAAGDFPMFDKFLHQCWGDDQDYEEKKKALQEAMAVTMFGQGTVYQRAICLYGAPKSGKSQVLRIVQTLVPDKARCAVPPESWSDRYAPSSLVGKILNICGELSESKLIAGEKFKDIVDGSMISGEAKYKPAFEFSPIATHWFASNHQPKSTDTSSGFLRRWLMLHFTKPIDSSERVANIGNVIAAEEREAITAWVVEGIRRVVQNSEYTLPKSHQDIIYEMGNLNNSVKFFLEEGGKIEVGVEDGEIGESQLYNLYWSFCQSAGSLRAVTVPKFRAMLRELQSEMPFRISIRGEKKGSAECIIEGIALKK